MQSLERIGESRLRSWRRLSILVMVAALVVTACGSSDEPSATTTTEGATSTTEPTVEDGPSIVYVTPNPIGVNEFLRQGEDGAIRAASRLGGSSQTFESTDAASMRANVEAAVEEAPSVIVLTTFSLLELANEFSVANPDQAFILVDACPEAPAPNLYCGVFREHEGSYLLGIEAGMLSATGKIGSVGALDSPFIHRWTDAFATGAGSVTTVEDSQLFVGGDNPFSDPARAKELTLSMTANGVDHIQGAAAAGNRGVFEGAAESGAFSYGVSENQCGLQPGVVVDNNLKLVDVVVDQLVGQVLDGTAVAFNSFGLAEGGVGVNAILPDVATSGCVIADHPDVIAEVTAVAEQIIDGSLVVEDPMMALLGS